MLNSWYTFLLLFLGLELAPFGIPGGAREISTTAQACDLSVKVSTDNTTGKASAQGFGGSGAYEYRLDDGPWRPYFFSEDVSNGTHTLTVRDRRQPDCSVNQSFLLRCATCPQPKNTPCAIRLSLTVEPIENALTGAASGGSGDYEFRVDGGYWVTSLQTVPVGPGPHRVDVRDALNPACVSSAQTRTGETARRATPQLQSRARNLRLVRQIFYETGGYGPDYDPGRKFPAFTVRSPAPVVMGIAGAMGTLLSDRVDLTRYGFTHYEGTAFRDVRRFDPLPSERKAYNATSFQDDIFKGLTDDRVPQGLVADPDWHNWPNPYAGLADVARLKRRLDQRWNVYVGPGYNGIFSYDYEMSWYLGGDGNNVDQLRTGMESGRYRAGGQSRQARLGQQEFRNDYVQTITEFWLQVDGHIRSKLGPKGQFLVYDKGPGVDARFGTLGGSTDERLFYGGDDGNGVFANAAGRRIGHFRDFASRQSLYYGQVLGHGATALLNLWSLHDTQLASMQANGLKQVPICSFIQPAQELDVSATGAYGDRAEAPTKQVGEGFALIPFFRRGGGWSWGSHLQPADVQAKGIGLDHFIHGRYLCSQLSGLIDGQEEYISAEISLDGGKTWLGDSQDYRRALSFDNPTRYTAFRTFQRLGPNQRNASALVLAIRNGNRVALAATRVGGTPAGKLSVQVRVKLPSGTFTDTLELHDREWLVGVNP